MRGDSLRDLYAKSLALLGLAALAGVGALVDYWPTDIRTPIVATRQLTLPSPVAAVALPSADTIAAWPVRRSVAPVAVRTVTTAPEVATVIPVPVPADASAIAPAVAPLALDVASDVQSMGAEVGLSAPPAPLPIDHTPDLIGTGAAPMLLAAPVQSASHDPSSMSFLTGALRKTGETIVKGGAKTGASIVDAMRAVGGAFKRVPWF